ncbi:hypothetical protein SAMN05216218_105144 [Halorientalis regularis]|uniref:Uncharacterized protein n=2 Tax=Halorientalis regularis TaxID=660518 RepID=A0A1G7K289_9EURY|nr:hypothetical protein SAMN05216218_105144 [Halorientalis regularis]
MCMFDSTGGLPLVSWLGILLIWVVTHAVFEVVAPQGFTTMALTGLAGGTSLGLSLAFLQQRQS